MASIASMAGLNLHHYLVLLVSFLFAILIGGRGASKHFFSKASVAKVEPLITSTVQKLCFQIEIFAAPERVVELSIAFSCMTTDSVTEYAFARCYNLTDSPTLDRSFSDAIIKWTEVIPLVKQFAWTMILVKVIPV